MEILWIFIVTVCPYQYGFLPGLRRFEFITGWLLLSRRLKRFETAKWALGARAAQHRWESTGIFFESRGGDGTWQWPRAALSNAPAITVTSPWKFGDHSVISRWLLISGSEVLYPCGVQAGFLTALTFLCPEKNDFTQTVWQEVGTLLTLKETPLKVFLILPHRQRQSKAKNFHQI